MATPPQPSFPGSELLRGRDLALCIDRQKPVESSPHKHAQIQIMFLFERGDCELRWWSGSGEANQHQLGEKQIWFVPPEIIHSCHWRTEAYVLVIYVPTEFLNRLTQEIRAAMLVTEPGAFAHRDPVVWSLAATLRFLWDERGGPDRECIESLAIALVVRLFSVHASDSASDARGKLSRERVHRINDYIQAHITEPIRMTALARQVGLCPGHFSEVFKRATGLTPSSYVLQLRLLRAQELIVTGADRLSEVASGAGFADQSHLTRCFRRAYGITPKMLLERAKAAKQANKT